MIKFKLCLFLLFLISVNLSSCAEDVRVNEDFNPDDDIPNDSIVESSKIAYIIGTGGVNGQGGGFCGSYVNLPEKNFALDDAERAHQRGTYHFIQYKNNIYAKQPGMTKWGFDSKGKIEEQGRMMTAQTWWTAAFASETDAFYHSGKFSIHRFNPSIMQYTQDENGKTMVLDIKRDLDAFVKANGTDDEITATKSLRDLIYRDGKIFATFTFSSNPMYAIVSKVTRAYVAVIDVATFSLEKFIIKDGIKYAGDEYAHNQGMIVDENGDLYILALGNQGNIGEIDGLNKPLDAKIVRIPAGKTDFDDYELNLGKASNLSAGESNTACGRGLIYAKNGIAFVMMIDKEDSQIGDDVSPQATNGPWYYGSVYRWCRVDLLRQTVEVIKDMRPTAGHKACAGVYDGDDSVILATYTDVDFLNPPRYNHVDPLWKEIALYRVNINTLESKKISDITSGGYIEAMARVEIQN